LLNNEDNLSRVSLLSLALTDDQVSVRWNAAKDLAKMGAGASAALPALSQALKSQDATTVLWARHAIARITGDTARHLPVLIQGLNDRRVFPGMAAAALTGFGEDAASAVPALIDQLSNSHPDNRWSAACALAGTGPAARAAVPALSQCLSDADEKVRWYAAWALGEIGPASEPAIAFLLESLDDFDDDVRGYSARALGKIGPAAGSAIPTLQRLLRDENAAVREEAAAAIELIGAGSG
jgi:HEAT repeat protein